MGSTITVWPLASGSGPWTTCRGGRRLWLPLPCFSPSTGDAQMPGSLSSWVVGELGSLGGKSG